jgi:hypothetical protein
MEGFPVTDEHKPDRTADRIALSRIDHRRWSPVALALSRALWDLPRRPGARGKSTHDLGIDRMAREQLTLTMMYEVVDEFEYRPTAAEIERIGRELFRMKPRLDMIRLNHRRMRQEEASHGRTPRLRRGPRAGG